MASLFAVPHEPRLETCALIVDLLRVFDTVLVVCFYSHTRE